MIGASMSTRLRMRPRWTSGVLAALATAAACGKAPAAPTTPVPTGMSESLKAGAAPFNTLVGTAVQSSLLADPRYTEILNRDFNYVTAEYEMKWATHEPSRGVFNFGPGDAIVNYALARGMQVKGHALVWHGSVPAWVNALPADELRLAFEHHIRTVVAHYRGRVLAWDVVNEAVTDDGGGLRETVFRQKLGDGYIADAFRWAREADPGAELLYNDYNGEGAGAKADRIYTLVKDLRAGGVPIDGVGLQMHIAASNRPSDANIAANMKRIAALGLSVNISEMDVKINSTPGTTETKLEAQRSAYRSVIAVCVAEPRCQAVTFWGFTDAHTWITGDSPLLYDTAYAPKPAYYGALDGLSGR